MSRSTRRTGLALCAIAGSLWLAACGGGGGGQTSGAPASCSVADQKAWLGDYMNEWYFWYQLSPRPDPTPYATVDSYYAALLYTGTNATFPADRWSYSQSTDAFNRFFGDGATLGYGVSVAGVEAVAQPGLPLWVRYIEANSPAGAQGVQRGDQVMSLNGISAASVIAANDFSALTANQAGDVLTLVLRRSGVDRTVVLTAAVFNLAPVQGTAVATRGGRKLGYVQVKDMISQALNPLDAAFAQFKAAGVQDLVLDLRYNGGGLVSTGATLASYIVGSSASGLDYARLIYNDKRTANNQNFAFASLASSLGLPRVFVLTGPRTCSASEQVINGLSGAGLTVVTIGATTCGKPVGFLPASACNVTYSAVNFESVNQLGQGRYFNGFAATCPVAEDFTAAQGGTSDPLMAEASGYASVGACSAVATTQAQAHALSLRNQARVTVDEGERQGLLGR